VKYGNYQKQWREKMHEKIRKFYVKIVERFIENVRYFKMAIAKYMLFL
jgi:hypothetical protein